ncbi:MAG: ferritin-like domain-containing protein [Herbaspirillum sp.]
MDHLYETTTKTDAATNEQSGRRAFFAKSSLFSLGALAAVTLGQSSPVWAQTKSTSTSDDIAMLNVALGLEYQAIAAYQVGAESGLLQKPVLALAVKFQGQHKAHAQILSGTISKLGGTPVMTKTVKEYNFPVAQLKAQADVLKFAAGLEKGAASAYLSVLPSFHNKELVSAAGSILGDETMHWAILLNALGEDPVPVAFIA